MNVVLVVFDTLRKDHLGAYGNDWIHTPHLNAFAEEAVTFTNAYPEALPTLPVRRALYTGQRTFPYAGHRLLKGDMGTPVPGWGPIPEEQDTVSELLSESGYRTALISDVYHQFKPSKNFHRGFDEWNWIRGQEQDRFRSAHLQSVETMSRHYFEDLPKDIRRAELLEQHLTNTAGRRDERDYFTAQVFGEAARWIDQNYGAENFFLVVESFDPHEPWDPPDYYRRQYDPSEEEIRDLIHSIYSIYDGVLNDLEVKRVQANYAGEVTLCDRWFGHFMETLRGSGRLDETLVVVTSDHGHNLGHEPGDKHRISKQGHPLTHSVADNVLMIRHPDRIRWGERYAGLVTHTDVAASILAAAKVEARDDIEGRDFWPAVKSNSGPVRDYVTIGWGSLVTVINDEWWCNASIWGDEPLLYRVQDDPNLERNLASDEPAIVKSMLDLAIQDAGGEIPKYFEEYRDHPSCQTNFTRFEAGGTLD